MKACALPGLGDLASGCHSYVVPALRLPKSFYLLYDQLAPILLVKGLSQKLGSQVTVHKDHHGKFPMFQLYSNSGGLGGRLYFKQVFQVLCCLHQVFCKICFEEHNYTGVPTGDRMK